MQNKDELSETLSQLTSETVILAKLLTRNNNQHRKSKPHILLKTVCTLSFNIYLLQLRRACGHLSITSLLLVCCLSVCSSPQVSRYVAIITAQAEDIVSINKDAERLLRTHHK
jgi:hypothetical protein